MMSVDRKLRREQNRTIGFVPTMGSLHEGHLSLIHEARAMCDVVVVSVFVNPAQFSPAEDFNAYPRDLTRDAALLAEYNVDYVFAPTVEEIYPPGFSTYVMVEAVRQAIENEPLARIDYASVKDAETLEQLDKIADRLAMVSLAVFVGETRLIDNVVLGKTKKHVAAEA